MSDLAGLVAACREGDEVAWEALVRRFQARIYGLACHYLHDPEEARDAAQEVFVRMYRGLASYTGQESFIPWMLRLARNCCIDRLRRARVRPPPVDLPLDSAPALQAAGDSPETSASAAASRALLEEALESLSPEHRDVLILKDIEGLSIDEVAVVLCVPVGTVKSRAARARVQLARAVLALNPSYGA